ncbi:MAG: hypothetical protein ACKOBG_04620 [Actinomycetota bacterium]
MNEAVLTGDGDRSEREVPNRAGDGEAGMTTAELLGNAALGVLALVVIWGLLQTLGVDIVRMIRGAVL